MTSRNLVPANKLFTGSTYRFLTYNSNVAYPNPLSNIYNASGVEVMNISHSNVRIYGNVGIGTTVPRSILDVNGNAIISGTIGIGNTNPPVALTVSRDASLGGSLNAGDGARGQLYLTGSTNTNKRLAFLYDTTTDKAYIESMITGTGGKPLILNNAGGFVGIGVGSPTQALDVAGNINFTGELYKNGALYNAMRYIGESATDYGATGTTVVIQQRSGNGPVGYTYGMLTTFNGESGRLQMYAPHNESGSSALYVKTGWNSSIMAWKRVLMEGDTVTTSLAVNAEISTNTMMRINYTSPTICFQDTDNNSAFLHCNGSLLYVLRGGTNATSWTPINGVWPWEWNLTNNASTCGGDLTVNGNLTVSGVTNAFMPRGGIIMWSGSIATIPTGWSICNGTNGTPDLRNRFIIGAGSSYGVAATGGTTTKTLSEANMPSHNHTGTTDGGGNHNHNVTLDSWGGGNFSDLGGGYVNAWTGVNGSKYPWSPTYGTTSSGNHTHTFSTSYKGSGSAFDITPPYYALAYIMKL